MTQRCPAPLGRRQLALAGCALTGSALARTATARAAPQCSIADWGDFARYSADNARLAATGVVTDCVFMGDSITERWLKLRPGFFTPGRVCRGITGQTTPQMLVRFRADVLALQPAVVHIMAGTNDLAGNTGRETFGMIEDNIRDMVELALVNGVRVVLASIPPASRFNWSPSVAAIQPIRDMNARLAAYAAQMRVVYADYHRILDDGTGGLAPGMSTGDVHPTAPAYALIEQRATEAINQARAAPKRILAPA